MTDQVSTIIFLLFVMLAGKLKVYNLVENGCLIAKPSTSILSFQKKMKIFQEMKNPGFSSMEWFAVCLKKLGVTFVFFSLLVQAPSQLESV